MEFEKLDSKRLRSIKLNLGDDYIVYYALSRTPVIARFIQVTRTGYNFFHEKSHRCIFRRSIYQINNTKTSDKMNFIIPWNWVIEKI